MQKLLATILLLVVPSFGYVQDQKPRTIPPDIERPREVTETKFIDIEKTNGKVTALKTATVTYEKDGKTLDLIAVIHIGEKEYYRKLNKQFVGYDALLYELVAPSGVKPDKESGLFSILVRITLDLDSQKERINYKKKNFVHADLSFAEMGKRLNARGDTVLTFGMRALADLMRDANLKAKQPINPLDATDLLDGKIGTKRLMAQQLLKAGLPSSITEVLIKDRNEAAMEVLYQQIKAGKKKMGLFYGAAHMPDFEKRLLREGWTKTGQKWLTAWDLSDD